MLLFLSQFEFNHMKIDMDLPKEIQFNNTCGCSIITSPQHILSAGFKPAMEQITTIIAASLVNKIYLGITTSIIYLGLEIYLICQTTHYFMQLTLIYAKNQSEIVSNLKKKIRKAIFYRNQFISY